MRATGSRGCTEVAEVVKPQACMCVVAGGEGGGRGGRGVMMQMVMV